MTDGGILKNQTQLCCEDVTERDNLEKIVYKNPSCLLLCLNSVISMFLQVICLQRLWQQYIIFYCNTDDE